MSDATELRRRLKPLIGEGIAISQGLRGTLDCRVTVTTSRGNMENLDGRVVIAFMSAGELSRRMARSVYFAAATRLYIVRRDAWLLPRVETELLYRFGPILFSTRPERGTLTINSLRVTPKNVRNSPKFRKHWTWDDPWRNGVIANLSSHAAHADELVWVVVESLQHARHLSKLMSDAPIASWRAGVAGTQDAIVTLSALAELPLPKPQLRLVYAAGGPPSRIFRAWIERALRAGGDLLVVDVDGGWHATEVKNSQLRLKELRSLGGHFRPLPKHAVRAAFR